MALSLSDVGRDGVQRKRLIVPHEDEAPKLQNLESPEGKDPENVDAGQTYPSQKRVTAKVAPNHDHEGGG